MRMYAFISMLLMVLGGHSAASGNELCRDNNDLGSACCSCQYVIPSKCLNKGKPFVIDKSGV